MKGADIDIVVTELSSIHYLFRCLKVQIKINLTETYDINNLENIVIPIVKKYIIDIINTFVQKKSIYSGISKGKLIKKI